MSTDPPRFTHALAAVAAAALASLSSAESRADTVTIDQITVVRAASSSSSPVQRSASAADWIDYDDCTSNVSLQLAVSASPSTGFVGYASLDGVDCSTAAARVTAGAACCPIASGYPANGVVSVAAQDLVKCLEPAVVDCEDTTSTGPLAVTLSFTVNDGAATGDVATLASTQSIDLALRPPAPPSTGLTVSAGDGEILIDVPAQTDATAVGYLVYCLPASQAVASSWMASSPSASSSGATATIDGGSAALDGGSDGAGGGSTGTTACPEYAIPGMDPVHPDPSSKYLCSTLGASATSSPVGGLANGVVYAVAIAAYDEAANIGPLSVTQCATPDAVDTFFGAYCRSAGSCPSGCEVGAIGAVRSGWPAVGLGGVLALGLWARRRRLARRSERPGGVWGTPLRGSPSRTPGGVWGTPPSGFPIEN